MRRQGSSSLFETTPQTTPTARTILVGKFMKDKRNTIISNESIDLVGPGPAVYNPLDSIKNVTAKKQKATTVMRQPSEIDHRVRKLHKVSSLSELSQQKMDFPGPASYAPKNAIIETES